MDHEYGRKMCFSLNAVLGLEKLLTCDRLFNKVMDYRSESWSLITSRGIRPPLFTTISTVAWGHTQQVQHDHSNREIG
jgi:hypothetical protein